MTGNSKQWIGFVAANGERQVKSFDSHEQAMTYREKNKRYWGPPARITIAYAADCEQEALEKIDLY